jgi:beta-xylosidase
MECETSGGVYKFGSVYYYSYHCDAGDGYQMGVATASNPLGPWTKSPNNPVMKTGDLAKKEWDSWVVASGNILEDPQNPGKYLMFYEGGHHVDKGEVYWSVGLAYGDTPAGPWVKHQANPIVKGELACDKQLACPNGCCRWPSCAGFYVGSCTSYSNSIQQIYANTFTHTILLSAIVSTQAT